MRSEHDRKEEVEKGRRKKADGPDSKNKNVGDALRAVYREAVSEEVPDEMIDLLNKLG
ncbi:NepR family anti-sigma factor [Stakelama marina]|uniref:NepR family anti-sigma factor n=1 Tax=Stakelama marina TaxID=2826939 RepID=UPI0024C34F30|nr:NepR family anti-sigma factor [Stakelama marina]